MNSGCGITGAFRAEALHLHCEAEGSELYIAQASAVSLEHGCAESRPVDLG